MAKIRIPEEVKKVAMENTQKKNKQFFDFVSKQLNDMPAVGFWGEHHKPDKEDFIFEDRHFKVLPVKVLRKDKEKQGETIEKYTGYFVAFDVDKIELNSVVEVKVPKDKTRMYVGTNAWQISKWCKKLGLKMIKIIGV